MGDYNVIPEDKDARNPKAWLKDALFQPQSTGGAPAHRASRLYRCFSHAPSRRPGQYTFWDYFGSWERDNGIRIDHILLSPQGADRLMACEIDRHVRGDSEKPSDHVPIWVDLDI